MSQLSLQLLQKTLQSGGFSMTRQRQTVFELLQNQKPQSIAELSEASRTKLDRSSLYRTLALFEKLDIIRQISIGWKYKLELSEHFSTHHHHVHCVKCGKVVDVKEPPQLNQYIEVVACKTGFRITSHVLELQGLCDSCQKR
jgi:Fe2+ or Zn2+ uptake regulation protein